MIDKDVAKRYGLDPDEELDPNYDPYSELDPVTRFFGAPFRFFASFGIVGLPFMALYALVLLVGGSIAIIGGLWFSVNALMYLLFG